MIYAVGDIHGEMDLLDHLIGKIRVDARRSDETSNKLVFVGDYIDRGPSSRQVLERVMEGFEDFETVCLRGNHEQAMLEVCDRHDKGIAKVWLSKTIGGTETLESYGIDRKAMKSGLKKPDTFWPLLEDVPRSHVQFLQSLPLTHIDGKFLFVHAGIRPGIALEAQRDDDLLWIRREFTSSRHDHGFVVVHGHSWKRRPQMRKNRIGIDTGAYATGRLSAVALEEGKKPRFIHVKQKRSK